MGKAISYIDERLNVSSDTLARVRLNFAPVDPYRSLRQLAIWVDCLDTRADFFLQPAPMQ
ncbi:hypothetical protein X745_12000 [Mesorhizobium sp. LNJC374B00]|nr:hypothetical protein X745_12000 [Mesorhizobium sp. LNJC374B00]